MYRPKPDFLRKLLNIERGEIAQSLLAVGFFFCVLAALMVLRPARDALGMGRGMDQVRWLFLGTTLVTLLVNPIFGWLVSRYRRMQFVRASYGFFALSLLAFYLLLTRSPASIGARSGEAFYVWFSVFNFFATMLFWALMSDRFTLAQSKRLFPFIATGGTLGAIVGPWLASVLAEPFGTPSLLLVSVLFLMLAVVFAGLLNRTPANAALGQIEPTDPSPAEPLIGGSAWAGVREVMRSRYLLAISGYVLILSVVVTFMYFTRLQMVAGLADQLDQRTALLARMDGYTQIATLFLQLLVSGHLIRRFGMASTLALLPITAAIGFFGLAILGSMTALIVFESLFRAVQRAVMRPARETLFTVLSREQKYKAKAVIDTFIYRSGDVIGAQTEGLLAHLGLGLYALAGATVPLAAVWVALGVWLGREQRRLANPINSQSIPSTDPPDIPAPAAQSLVLNPRS